MIQNILLINLLNKLIQWDTNVSLAINGLHSEYWDTFMWLVSDKIVWVPLYLSILYIIFKDYNWKIILACLVTLSIILLVTDGVCAHIIRPIVGRMRPSNLDNPISGMVHIVDGHRGGRFGFPSAHSSNTWGLTFFVCYLFRRHWLSIFMAAWACLVCYSRMYLGVHYLGDTIAGMLLAFISSSVLYYVFMKVSGHKVKKKLKYPYLPICIGGTTIIIFFILSFFIRIY